jgi:hypothetical protein
MWIPRWFKLVLDALHTESRVIKESLAKQENSVKNTSQAWEEKQREVGAAIAASIQAHSNAATNYEKPQRDKEHRLQWRMFWVALAGTIFAAAAAAGAWYYATLAKGQLDQMIEATRQARKSADTAACALRESQRQFDRTLEQMTNQTTAQQTAASAAEDTVSTARDQIRRDQRAWITVEVGETTGDFAIQLRNTGRTPAVHVAQIASFALGTGMKIPDVDLSKTSSSPIPIPKNLPPQMMDALKREGFIRKHPPSGYVVAPGDSQIASAYHGKFAQIFTVSADPRARNYIQGRVTYDDVFKGHHETIYCFWYSPPSDFVMCNDHNKMD